MRELADWNVSRYADVASWPLREALLALLERMKRQEHDAYERQISRWWAGRVMQDKPAPPSLIAHDLDTAEERA